MKAVLFYGPQDIRYENTLIKPLQEGEILVKVEAALTCGTDVKTFRRGHPVLIKKIPSGFGHEFSGVITNLSSKTSAELASAAGKELAKEQISNDINSILAGEREVLRVSFGQFIIQ